MTSYPLNRFGIHMYTAPRATTRLHPPALVRTTLPRFVHIETYVERARARVCRPFAISKVAP